MRSLKTLHRWASSQGLHFSNVQVLPEVSDALKSGRPGKQTALVMMFSGHFAFLVYILYHCFVFSSGCIRVDHCCSRDAISTKFGANQGCISNIKKQGKRIVEPHTYLLYQL